MSLLIRPFDCFCPTSAAGVFQEDRPPARHPPGGVKAAYQSAALAFLSFKLKSLRDAAVTPIDERQSMSSDKSNGGQPSALLFGIAASGADLDVNG